MSRRAAESHATRSSSQLQTAKAQFSEVFRRTRTEGLIDAEVPGVRRGYWPL